MIRKGLYKPTIEDVVEISGIETLHPGGFALTKRTAEIANLNAGLKLLDVSSGRGTQAIYYASEFGAEVTGIDISDEMVNASIENARLSNLNDRITFRQGDSQNLPFDNGIFDVVVNECAVGIPDDSQKVLNEMVRVARANGVIVIHESTWRKELSDLEKDEIAERYGTTPLEFSEWLNMLEKAGVQDIKTEFDEWSKPEMFWKVRKDRDVQHYSQVMSLFEKIKTSIRILKEYGIQGVVRAFQNERRFYQVILDGKLGYCLFKGVKGETA